MSFPKSNFSGFPFDKNDRDRERPFRSKLDDIAKRHPEFAEHLKLDEAGGFPPFRSHLRDRFGAEGSKDPFEEYRRFERPFGGGFERFPFQNRGFEEPEFGPSQQQQTPQPNQQQQPHHQQPPVTPQPQQQQHQQEQKEAPRQVPVQERKLTNPTLIQSNTVDLGQKQDPVDDRRNQRSMSAPPENRNPNQRFVSTCNIPINSDTAAGDQHQQQQQQEQGKPQQQHQSRINERVIPIHVEGRDIPVIPKNVHQTFTPPPPQPERVFGHKPSHFTQFLNRDPPHIDRPFGSPSEDMFRQPYFGRQPQRPHSPTGINRHQQQPPQQQQQQKQPPQQQTPPPPPQQQQQEEQEKPAPPPQQPKTAIDHIQAIQRDVLDLMDQVEKFTGKHRDKQYLYLDEMLTRNLLKLDNIDTEGKENIRSARKEAIKCIQKCISILEAKATANSPELQQKAEESEKMDVEGVKTDEKPVDESSKLITAEQQQTAMEAEPLKTLEVSGVVKSGTQTNVPDAPQDGAAPAEAPKEPQQMEVETSVTQTEPNVKQEAIPLPPPPEYKETQPSQETTEAQNDEKPKEKKKSKKKEKVEKK